MYKNREGWRGRAGGGGGAPSFVSVRLSPNYKNQISSLFSVSENLEYLKANPIGGLNCLFYSSVQLEGFWGKAQEVSDTKNTNSLTFPADSTASSIPIEDGFNPGTLRGYWENIFNNTDLQHQFPAGDVSQKFLVPGFSTFFVHTDRIKSRSLDMYIQIYHNLVATARSAGRHDRDNYGDGFAAVDSQAVCNRAVDIGWGRYFISTSTRLSTRLSTELVLDLVLSYY